MFPQEQDYDGSLPINTTRHVACKPQKMVMFHATVTRLLTSAPFPRQHSAHSRVSDIDTSYTLVSARKPNFRQQDMFSQERIAPVTRKHCSPSNGPDESIGGELLTIGLVADVENVNVNPCLPMWLLGQLVLLLTPCRS